jgi:undecaprenyl-diphosphatase
MSYLQAIVIGIMQGVTELFPISSLGHSVLLPAFLGWDNITGAQSADESFYLAFLVGLHVATATALLIYFRETWRKIALGFVETLRRRKIETPDERLAWLLIVATIPVGLVGLLFEHPLRVVFAKPVAAGAFLIVNGAILFLGERLRIRRTEQVSILAAQGATTTPDRRLDTMQLSEAGSIGIAQVLSLFAGISRSGVTMVAGLIDGLDHEDAARFSFLLATPIIFAAGLYKIPDLLGPNGDGVRGQVLVGSVCAGLAAYVAVRFLMRWFETRTLTPFAIYSVVVGTIALVWFGS